MFTERHLKTPQILQHRKINVEGNLVAYFELRLPNQDNSPAGGDFNSEHQYNRKQVN